MSMRTLVVIFGALLASTAGGETKSQPDATVVTVCDVLKAPLKFNGRMVAIRGYVVATDEGAWLFGDCTEHLVTNGFTWPDSVWLATSLRRRTLHKVTFAADYRALYEASKSVTEAAREGEDQRVFATYEGLLETQNDLSLETYIGKDGNAHPAGFGHMAGAPAQLVVKTVRDLKVERSRRTP